MLTRSSDTDPWGSSLEPYILPAVTVGLRLHLLSPTAGDLGQPLRGQFQFSLPLLHTGQQLSERQGNCTTPHLCISLYHGIKDIKKFLPVKFMAMVHQHLGQTAAEPLKAFRIGIGRRHKIQCSL